MSTASVNTGIPNDILEHVPDAVAVVERDWCLVYVNAALERLVGRDRQGLLGKNCWELAPQAIATVFEQQFRRAMSEQIPVEFEAFYAPLSISVEVRAFPTPAALTLLFRDVTARKRVEESLREGQERYRAIVEAYDGLIYICSQDYRIEFMNQRFIERTGRNPTGELCYKALHDRDSVCPWCVNERVLAGETVRWELQSPKDNRWYSVVNTPIRHADGTISKQAMIQDISERKQFEDQLQEAKVAAEKANAAKDHFLAVLSHELRTPLSPVLLGIQMMEAAPDLPASFKEIVKVARRNVELECRLIDDLLDLTKISRGTVELNCEPVDLHQTLQQVIDICRDGLQSKTIKLCLKLKATRYYVGADAARLHQVFWNLLRNAIKFTPAGGRITVATENITSACICVTVKDNGIGFTPEVLPHIFNAFEQGSPEVAHKFGGLGLGMAISKALVDLHGGTITARSDGQGKGATFTVQLWTCSRKQATALQPKKSAKGRGGRILLVEDHPDTGKLLHRLLMSLGYDVQLATNVASALEAAKHSRFDVVVSDIGLPDGTGLDLMKQLNADRPVKGIAVSGWGMPDDIRRSKEAGFIAHLTKPVDVDSLEKVLKEAIAM